MKPVYPETRRLFRALTGLLPDAAVFVVDGSRSIRFWSEGAERLLGFRAEDVVGEHCLKANRCVTCMQGCGLSTYGDIKDVPLTLFRQDGRPVRVLKSAQAFYGEDGSFQGGVEMLRPLAAAGVPAEPTARFDELKEFHGLRSRDPEMNQVFDRVRSVAASSVTVLVRGESGTGKELVARAVHAESPRKEGPFVAVNCSAITASLAESTLFGHRKGAFTGALQDRQGLFVQADGGTLFLDEVAELSPEMQAKLLRVLEDGEVVPVGACSAERVDVRIVAATHRSLREEVSQGRFREDLMFRLRVVPVYLPPLRERTADIEPLVWHFLEREASRGGRWVERIEPECMRRLLEHPWPGNVRELRNAVQHAYVVGQGSSLRAEDLPREFSRTSSAGGDTMPHPGPTPPSHERLPVLGPQANGPGPKSGSNAGLGNPWLQEARPSVSAQEQPAPRDPRGELEAALRRHPRDQAAAARDLGISRTTLWRRRKRYGL